MGYRPTLWGDFQWAANLGVPERTTTAREDPGHFEDFKRRPAPVLPTLSVILPGAGGVHTVDDDLDLVPRKLIKIGVAEPGDEHLISVT